MRAKREYDYIAHCCINPDCGIGFVDVCPTKSTTSEQKWKYCPKCENAGYVSITLEQQILNMRDRHKDKVMPSNKKPSNLANG